MEGGNEVGLFRLGMMWDGGLWVLGMGWILELVGDSGEEWVLML